MNAGEGAHAEFAQVIPLTVRWLERAVIGLNLCPFAKSVHVKGQVHYAVTHAEHREDLLADLTTEIEGILAQPPSARDTTLLIAPRAFPDFWDFNAFMPECDRLLKRLKLQGVLQIANFHPQFQFVGTDADDISNYTNRAPYPILHLLREDSIDRAVQAFADPGDIFEKNIETLKALGHSGWAALGLGCPMAEASLPDSPRKP